MLFNSFDFAIFFPIVTIGFFVLPHGLRWAWLLAASCYFYMAFVPVYILILFFTIIIDYYAGLLIEQSVGPRRKLWLTVSLIANIGILAFFKYFNFLNDNVAALAHALHWNYPIKALEIILPIGLSFHTFQAMSYTIEVYRGNQKAERHFGIYALYVMFYPQLVAGPIERPQNLLHQFHEKHFFVSDRAAHGLKRMLWGLFKKTVVADRLAILVNHVYARPGESEGIVLILATVFFAFQIYCDFSGYSDVALGSAEFMGFKLMKNFDRPYASRSISEFWRRWHISLSTWFKDYLYFPMGGNRVSPPRWYWNLFFTFLISGLWHGANWTYIIWGALNGFYLLFAIWTAQLREKLWVWTGLGRFKMFKATVQIVTTFSLIGFAWVFFRAESWGKAIAVLGGMGRNLHRIVDPGYLSDTLVYSQMGFKRTQFFIAILSIIFLEVAQYFGLKRQWSRRLVDFPPVVRWSVYGVLTLGIMFFGVFKNEQFIYFQF